MPRHVVRPLDGPPLMSTTLSDMSGTDGTRGLRAIMVTDVVGYSAQMREDESRALAVLARQRALLPPLIASHGGTVHKEIGDGLLASFPSAVDALHCARTLQTVLAAEAFRVRIGLHLGDVLVQGGDLFGDGVNMASRIEPLAEPGGIALSADFANAVRNQPGFDAVSLGPQALKNLGAPVEVFAIRAGAAAPDVGTAPASGRTVGKRLAAVLALALAAGIGALWILPQLRAPQVPVPEAGPSEPASRPAQAADAPGPAATAKVPAVEKSIAVLPFMNMSGDAAQEYFSDGITEELLNHLAQVSELRVTARTSSFAFKGKQLPIPEIAVALGVAHVLEGSVRRAGNTVRITVQLIRAADGTHLWSQTYDRPLDDIFHVQDEISAAVTKELEARLLHAGQDRGSVDPEAYELYLQAKELRSRQRPEELGNAEELLVKATTLAPRFTDAWSELAITRFQIAGRGGYYRQGPDQKTRELMAGARDAAKQALAIDPGHAPTHARLAAIDRGELGLEVAAAHIRRAIELNEADPEVRLRTAETLALLGRLEQAIAFERVSLERDPVNSVAWMGFGMDLETIDRLDEAEAAVRKAISLNPEAAYQHSVLALILTAAGRIEDARRELAREPERTSELWALAILENVRGNRAGSDEALQQLIAGNADTMAFQAAEIHACRDEKDAAFTWLEKSIETRDMGLDIAHLSTCLENLHGDPRWLPFLQRIGRDPERLARIPLEVVLPAPGG